MNFAGFIVSQAFILRNYQVRYYNSLVCIALQSACSRIMYNRPPLLLLLLATVIAAAAATAEDVSCSSRGLETSCSVRFPDRLVVDDDSVYVGLENKLVRFSLELDHQTSIDRAASSDAVRDCERYRQPDCGNYVLTMLVTNLTSNDISDRPNLIPLVNKTVLFICSTFGFSPQCQLCDAKNISNCVNTSEGLKLGYSPYDRRFNNVYTLTKDRVFYTGSSFDDKNGLQAIAKFPNPFTGEKFSLHTYTSKTWRWLFNPTFISLYEVDQYIYFFWREEAFEANRRVYTRVGRVCKSDEGLGSNSTISSVFSTFVKARMTCSIPQDSNNRHAFHYDEIQSTHLISNGSSHTLYAVFSTPSNGPASSAICTYSFDNEENSLNTVFNGDYLFGNSGSDAWTTVSNPNPFDCPGEGNNQRSTEDAEQYLLMEESVQQSTPLLVYIETGAYITSLVVDRVQWNGQSLEVFYIALSNGMVKQVVQNISEVTLYTSNGPVNKLVLHEYHGRKYCYITSDDVIAVIQLGRCDYYPTCSQCINDIYCRWTGHSCTGDVTVAANVTCPAPVPTTISNVDITTVYRTTLHTVTIEKCPTPLGESGIVNSVAVTSTNEEKCNNLPVVIGTTIGGIILGFIICTVVFICIYFIKRPRATPKESPMEQANVDSREYDDDDTFAPPIANHLPGNNMYYSRHPLSNGYPHHPTSHVGRTRTESTKRLMSISSDVPDSPSPPNTLRLPKHEE